MVQDSSQNSRESLFERDITALRQEIDTIDEALIEGISKRLALSYRIGLLKRKHNKPIYNLQREQDVIAKLTRTKKRLFQAAYAELKNLPDQKNTLPPFPEFIKKFPDESLQVIYHEVLSASRAIQKDLNVAYLGAPGSFSHMAALDLFGSATQLSPHATFDRVFKSLKQAKDTIAIIPIENSSEGIVGTTVDLMVTHNIRVLREHFMPVRLALLSRSRSLRQIHTLASHVQPLAQARRWISDHLPEANIRETQSTAHAADLASQYINYACITSQPLAVFYPKLNILARNLEDQSDNTTRFLVITTTPSKSTSIMDELAWGSPHPKKAPAITDTPRWMTTIIFAPAVADKPGTLLEVLKILKQYKVNMTNLVSRPSKKKAFSYLFYGDLIGHQEEKSMRMALAAIEKISNPFKCLGSYPRAQSSTSP